MRGKLLLPAILHFGYLGCRPVLFFVFLVTSCWSSDLLFWIDSSAGFPIDSTYYYSVLKSDREIRKQSDAAVLGTTFIAFRPQKGHKEGDIAEHLQRLWFNEFVENFNILFETMVADCLLVVGGEMGTKRQQTIIENICSTQMIFAIYPCGLI